MVERKFEAGQDVGVEPGLVELRPGEGDQVAPLVAQAEHVGEQCLALGEVAVAVQQEVAQGSVECSVARAEQKQGAAGGLAVEGSGVFRRGEAAAGAGEVGQGARDLGADRVDGADVEAVGVVDERPAELTVSGEDRAGEFPRLGLEVVLGWRWFGCGCGELLQDGGFGGG